MDKPLKRPRGKLRLPITSIGTKVIFPILSPEVRGEYVEKVFSGKIAPFQKVWLDVIQNAPKTSEWKQKPHMNLEFYVRTFEMVNSNPIFSEVKSSIIDTIEILKEYEITIYSIIDKRLALLRDALKEDTDEKDLLNSVYGSYMALLCFWYVARDEKRNRMTVPTIAKIGHSYAIKLDSYTDTLDILTNPEERAMMKRAQQWERSTIQNKSQ